MTDNVLQVRGLNVYYGESHILRNVDLHVAPGQMACLIGLNGVGKTTLLKTIIGLLRQRSGSLAFEGRDISALPPHRRARAGIGYVPQGREIIPQLTVRENLLLGLEAALLLVLTLRKFPMPAAADVGDKSVFAYLEAQRSSASA